MFKKPVVCKPYTVQSEIRLLTRSVPLQSSVTLLKFCFAVVSIALLSTAGCSMSSFEMEFSVLEFMLLHVFSNFALFFPPSLHRSF